MRLSAWYLAIVSPVLLAPSVPAWAAGRAAYADIGTTATRLSIDGQPGRFYPTYGRQSDREMYAPLREELAGLGLQFRITGSSAEAVLRGKSVATWPVVEKRELLPKTGTPATVLHVGASYYLPVRACAALVGRPVAWDYSANLLRLGEGTQAAKAAPTPAPVTTKPATATPAKTAAAPATSPAAAPSDATRAAALAMAAAVTRTLPVPGGPLVRGSLRATTEVAVEALNNPAPTSTPPSPVVQAVVRRSSNSLAFRGGVVQRNAAEILRSVRGPLQGKLVCVDAGHGGHSGGAQGLNGAQEKNVTLQIALEVAQALQDAGATIIMPRVDDTYISLDERIDFANTQKADLFVSIHCNAMPTHNTVSGTETYYDTPQSAALARAIHPQVAGTVAGRDGGIRRRGFAVIRRTTMPSVLVEVAYIDHLGDEAKLTNPLFQRQVGESIRDGVVRFFDTP